MKFKGWQKVSLIDFPGRIATIVFTGGCNFRCPYCHNPELVIGWEKLPDIDEEEVFRYLERRKGLIDGIAITGGEPLLHQEIIDFIRRAKSKGYPVKIDTNGAFPEVLAQLINDKLIDFIAMDIKGAKDRYAEVAGVPVDIEKIDKSIKMIMESGIDYEFRTSVLPMFFNTEEAKKIGEWIKGAKRYVLQIVHTVKTLDERIKEGKIYLPHEVEAFVPILKQYVESVIVR